MIRVWLFLPVSLGLFWVNPNTIYQYVFALAHGAGRQPFYYGDWIRQPGVAVCSCNDGLRPVIFKLETTDEASAIDYTPVR